MQKEISNVENIIMKKDKFKKQDIEYIVHKTTNKLDFLTLNYIEKSIISNYGMNFVENNKNKIQVIVSLLLEDSVEGIYNFYTATFGEYMKATNNSYEGITSFNLIYVTLIHISLKIIRKSVK